jgi:hypothetical protein
MKGSIQVSVGFLIIMVVSALVLIFIMGWLGQIFPTLTRIGDYATNNAENEMMKKFAEGSDVVASTIPTRVAFQKGSEVEFIVGVKKTSAVPDTTNFFAICVASSAATSGCNSPSVNTPIVSASGDFTSKIKFLLPPTERVENRGDVGRFSILMQIPSDAPQGFYSFRILACGLLGTSGTCTGMTDPNLVGETDFIVRVQ